MRIWHGSLLGMTRANPTWSLLHKNLISFVQLSIKLKMRRIHLKRSKHKYLQRISFTYILVLSHFNPFLACGLFLQPLKTSKNLWFSDFFQGLLKKTTGMKWVKLKPEKISQEDISTTSPCLKTSFWKRLTKGFTNFYKHYRCVFTKKLALLFIPQKLFIRDWNQ